ncbi:hypothetical protein CYY_010340, partial [Polysphondylium violaceum]
MIVVRKLQQHQQLNISYYLFILFIIIQSFVLVSLATPIANNNNYKQQQAVLQKREARDILNENFQIDLLENEIESGEIARLGINKLLLKSESVNQVGNPLYPGEYCEQTTFDFNSTTDCPNDCYSLWGQGSCVNGACNCTYYYTGEDCSVNYNPDSPTWDHMDCNHGGRYCPSIFGVDNLYRQCYCPPGWSGLECNVCESHNACMTTLPNATYETTCDNSAYVNELKYYSCVVTSAQVNEDLNNSTASATLQCGFPTKNYTNGEGVCSMNLYYRIHGSPLYFNCSFTDCTRNIAPGQIQVVTCENSACTPTTYCSGMLALFLEQVKTVAQFSCDQALNCSFYQAEIAAILPNITLGCSAGECNYSPPPIIYPVPIMYTNSLYVYISSGIGLVVFSIILGAVFLIFSFQEKRKQFVEDVHVTCELRFENISCVVSESRLFGPKHKKVILDNVSGVCPPGQLTALMGLSGSGKTSLLDILSGRKNVGDIQGRILVNGMPIGKNFKRISGYVTQEDIMIGTLTCREHLLYTALLKLPENMSKPQKMARVDNVLKELRLDHVADNPIGTPEKRGISGGERRRLSIAAELLVDPSIIFLDEPTSGLDSHSASELINLLKQLAANRDRTIIFSIHQPSAEIFEQFDNLILLHHGNPYYSGKATDSVQFFVNQKIQASKMENVKVHLKNPADYIISVVTDNSTQRLNNHSSSYQYAGSSSHHNRGEDDEIEQEKNVVNLNTIANVQEYATSFWTQFFVICRRSLLNYFRNPFLLRTTYFVHISVGLILGYLFWKLPNNLEPGCQNRFGSMFFMIALLSFGSITSLDLFYNDRIIFIRERANGHYRTSSYFLAKVISDIIPMRVIPPILLGSICYYMIGFRSGILHFIYFLISLVLTSTTASSMCMAISTISPSFGTANMISILMLFVFLLFDGFLLARQSVPGYLSWLVWLSFMSYGLEIPVVNEFNGLWIFYNPPNTQGTWADGLEFLTTIGANPNRLFTD